MKTDRMTKGLLALIALALLMNALNPWLRPVPVSAQTADTLAVLSGIQSSVSGIEADLSNISGGNCMNATLC